KLPPLLKHSLIVFAALLVLFFLVDDIIMPRYVQQGETTYVPDVIGMETDEALRVLEAAGLEGKEAEIRPDKTYPEGTVAMQIPPAGAEVKYGRGVYLTVSGGETLVRVPALRGRSVRDATLALEQVGLKVGEITYQVSTQFPENTVIGQSIPEGTNVRGASSVSMLASQGASADRIPVPNLTRKSLSEAERILLQAGLTPGSITHQVNNDFLPNTVIDQFPRYGGFLARGESVQLFVTQRQEEQELEN
ncbi:MAG TPA: PASTA domain-containing protein, partial [Bacteroidota bacterium]